MIARTQWPTRETRVLPFDHNHRDCMIISVTQRYPGRCDAAISGECVGASVQNQERLAAFLFVYVNVPPAHCFSDPGAKRFRDCFLRGKASCEMSGWKFHGLAISDLPFGKNALHEAVAKPIERMLNALDVNQVHPDTNDTHPL